MNLTTDDKMLLQELCKQHQVSFKKVIKLLDIIREYEFKERRTGIYDALRDTLRIVEVEAGSDEV